jgi:hypothetical protein
VYINLNVIKTIPKPKITIAIEIGATFIEIICFSKGVTCKQEGSSSIDNETASFG